MIAPRFPRFKRSFVATESSSWSRALLWVPSLYLAMGVPFNVVQVTARMYQSLEVPKLEIAIGLGWIGVIWSLKPIWAALLDRYRSKRFFVIGAQLVLSVLFAVIALSLTRLDFFRVTLLLLTLVAFVSATQDICADGIYITALDTKTQTRLIGVQSMFWGLSKFFVAGWFVYGVERFALGRGWSSKSMWQIILLSVSALMLLLSLFHYRVLPPGAPANRPLVAGQTLKSFARTAASFVDKPQFWGMMSFVLLYRVGEGLLLMQGPLFLQASKSEQGLGLSAGMVSTLDGGLGTASMLIGGLLGAAVASTWTLPRTLRWLAVLLNVPHVGYVLLATHAASGPVSLTLVAAVVGIEKFGYGFGFVGNMLYLMQQVARGKASMTHYAFGTALMNLVLVPMAMISGPLVEHFHYRHFFWLVLPVSLISVLVAWRAPFRSNQSASGAPPNRNQPEPSDEEDKEEDEEAPSAQLRAARALGTRASTHALLLVIALLILDSSFLGALRSDRAALPLAIWAALLLTIFAGKAYLALRTLRLVRETLRVSEASGPDPVSRNARGARSAVLLCSILGSLTLAAGLTLLAG